jgi:LmbE family N-acetylglucosaminyl deacetylase
MQAAAGLLRAELFACGFGDGTLFDNEVTRRSVIEVFRRFRPTLVLAHAPNDYHPDHRAASSVAEAASWFCASRGHKSESEPLEQPPALWWMDTINLSEFEPGFFVDVSAYAHVKEQMLLCHKSQLQREGDRDFTPLVGLMQLQQAARGAQAGVAAAEAFRIHAAFKRVRAW